MKKLYLFLLAVAACTFQMTVAQTVKIGDLYYTLSGSTAQVVKDQTSDKSVYKAYTSIAIPSSFNYSGKNYSVTSIGTSAFESLTNLQSVTMPSTITTIGTDAFYGCTKLSNVNLPEGLTTINLRAFYNCALTEITIPSTVTSIGNAAFKGNPTTTIIWKPKDCSIGTDSDAPFYGISSVTSFTFADGVEVVPAYICKNMSKIDTVVLPASVSRLGQAAFMNCSSLKSINLPKTQKTLPAHFFEGCTSLEKIELPATLTTIETDAFYGCSKLNNVNLHEGLTTINLRAFYNCKLTEITIPSTVTSIGNAAFKGNPTTTIIWKPKDCSIGTDSDAPFYSLNSQVTSFTFADGVEVVPAYICKNMSKLDTIVLPASVSRLGQAAFMNCFSLKSINLPKTQKTLPAHFLDGCTSLEKIELPATLTTIETDAFYGCTKLSNVNLPEGLTTINLRAFYNCALTEITIPSTVTSIGNAAFKGNPTTTIIWKPKDCSIGTDSDAPFYSTNSQVTSFTFADGVEVVPAYICKNMSKLDTIVLPASVSRLGQAAFMYCTSLKSINLPKTQKTLPAHFLDGCTSLEKIELPATLTTIETDAFYGCTKLSNVNLPEGLTTINLRAFYNCALTEITIPSTVTSIGNAAFKENPITTIVWKPKDCSIGSDNYAPFYSTSSQVTTFTFADGVEVVPAYICKNMSKLDTIVLPASVSRLGQAAFMYCTSLKSINLPKTQKTLPASFLEGCSSLEKIELPATLTTIETDAFYGCSGLKEIYSYAKTPPTIVERSVYNVNKQTCKLYVPTVSLELYAKATVWKDFLNRIGMEPIHHEFAETACDEYTWDGTTYYESGDKVKEYVAVNGLDSIVVLHLTINHSFKTETIVSELESYTWNGKTYTESGDYEFVGTTAAGCDSTAILHLTIIPVWQVTLTQPDHGTISVVENIALDKVPDGTELHFAAIPDEGYEFEAWQGCNVDGSLVVKENISISCTFREIPKEIHQEFAETACDEYTWDGTTYYESGDKVKEYVAVNGLDSIVVLHLTINHSSKTETIVSELESYTWNGKTYTESGDYEFVGTTAAGCDSTAVLHLTIIPVWQVTLTQPEHGTISVVENIALDKVPDGTELHFAAIPAEGYEFEAWQGCNADGSLVVNENVSVSCTFKEIESAVLNIETEADEPQKIIRNGVLYIRHNGRTYTITGVEIM